MERQLDILVEIISPEPADVMVIAGDLDHYYSQDCTFLTRMWDIYQRVILVTGNHDLYLVSRNIQEKYAFDSTNRVKEMKEFCAQDFMTQLSSGRKTCKSPLTKERKSWKT